MVIDRILADVNGHAITLSTLKNELALRQVQQPSLVVKKQVLTDLIDQEIMFQAADRSGILLGRWDKKVADEIRLLQIQYKSESDFLDYLTDRQLTLVDLTDWMRRQLILQSFVTRQFTNQIESDKISQSAQAYYQKNRLQFWLPAHIRFQYILITIPDLASAEMSSQARILAETIHQQLVDGKTFQQISQRYGDQTVIENSIQQPKVTVIHEPKTGPANTKLEIDIAQLEIGSISKPKLTIDGYLIAKLLGRSDAQQQNFDSVQKQIESQLRQQEIEILLDNWLENERQNSNIQNFSRFEEN